MEPTEPDIAYELSDEQITRAMNAFTYHPPKGTQQARYVAIRDIAKAFALGLCQSCPPSRELSLALTNLENCVMWANASIARNE